MGFSDKLIKSDIIGKGENLLVLRNKGKVSHNVTIEMSGVSKSFFSYDPSSNKVDNSNLILTTKTIQSCLRDFYISCAGATHEAAFAVPLNSAFKLVIDDEEYYFTNVQDYIQNAQEILPLYTIPLFIEDLCERAVPEATISLLPDQPFKLTINGEEYFFDSVHDFLKRDEDLKEIIAVPFVSRDDIPINEYELLTSKVYPIILKEDLKTDSFKVTESGKHLILSPSFEDTFSISSYSVFDAFLRQDGETVNIDTTPINSEEAYKEANKFKTSYKVNDVTYLFPLQHLTGPTDQFRTSYSVNDVTLRDNLIVTYDDPSHVSTSYKALDAVLKLDVHTGYFKEDLNLNEFKSLDVTLRDHLYTIENKDNNVLLSQMKVLDPIINDTLVFLTVKEENISTTNKVLDTSIRDHLIGGTSPYESITYTTLIEDAHLKADLKFASFTEQIQNTFVVQDPISIMTLQRAYQDVTQVSTTFTLIEPVIDGHAVVPINCSGALEQTEVINFNGKFNVYLEDVKLNNKEMTIEEIKTLLANYNIRVDIKT